MCGGKSQPFRSFDWSDWSDESDGCDGCDGCDAPCEDKKSPRKISGPRGAKDSVVSGSDWIVGEHASCMSRRMF
jgi:hypothetical protein